MCLLVVSECVRMWPQRGRNRCLCGVGYEMVSLVGGGGWWSGIV